MNHPSIQQDRLLGLFRDMVDIYSPSGKEEELIDYLVFFLRNSPLHVEPMPVSDNRTNLLISHPRGQSPDTLFLGHIDTVPAFDIEEYHFSKEQDHCSGLGTADMKGGCAAMIEAWLTAAEADCLPDRYLLALVVGEEESGDGTQALLNHHSFQHALVAEPTDLQPCLQHFGYVETTIRIFGYRRHAAVADSETDAIRKMLRLLLRLEEHVNAQETPVVLNIRDLHSSESGFAEADRCAAQIDLHLPPGIDANTYARNCRLFLDKTLRELGANRYEIEFTTLANSFSTPSSSPLPSLLHDVYQEAGMPWKPSAFASHSDANLLWDAGCLPVIMGPGQLSKAHTRDEAVAFSQVEQAANLYTALLTKAVD